MPSPAIAAWYSWHNGNAHDGGNWLGGADFGGGLDGLEAVLVVIAIIIAVILFVIVGSVIAVVFGRPFLVVAENDRGVRREWRVRGMGASRRMVADIAARIESGAALPPD